MRFLVLLFSVVSLCACQSVPHVNRMAKQTPTTNYKIAIKKQTNRKNQTLLPLNKQPQNIWLYISNNLTFNVPENKKIKNYQKWILKHPNHIQVVNKRAKPFLFIIKEKLQAANMPLDLAILPIIESSFDIKAYSQYGAAGLWQFMPATAKIHGLSVNSWYDARQDVYKSTDAAISLLKRLHKRFNNDWLLALAAYNSGQGRVLKAISKNKRLGKPTDYWSLDLPRETSSYVPKFLALVELLREQENNKFKLPFIKNKMVLTKINPHAQMDLEIAAKLTGISLREFKSLNAGYHRWLTSPRTYQSLIIPINKLNHFKSSFAKLKNKNARLVTTYKVKSGDSLGYIAKRYHTSVKSLKQVNHLKSSFLKIGQRLKLPPIKAYKRKRSVKSGVWSKANRYGNRKLHHKVSAGESLWTISKKYRCSLKDLARWNHLSKKPTLRIGQHLVVWKKKGKS